MLFNALKWSFFSELASKAIQPVVFVVLARLLTPDDFGVMTSALMVISFSQIFWEAGMGKALIQRQNDVQDAANVAFWINIVLGILLAGLVFIWAQSMALVFFQDDRVTLVLKVMALQILLGAISSVHIALLQKNMDFKKLFWIRFATVTLPGLASIPLAWNGLGYWALVGGALVGQLAQVGMLWRTSNWKPEWRFQRAVAKEMALFGAWVGLSGLLLWFYVWMDSLIVGMYLGSHDLGIYRVGGQFASMVFLIVFAPVVPVLYSFLSKTNHSADNLMLIVPKIVRTAMFVAIPMSFIIFGVAEQIEALVFGQEWAGVALVIGIMALVHGYSWVVGLNGEIYRAMGKPAYETIVTGSVLIIYLLAYWYSIQIGFETFVYVRLALAVGSMFLHFVVLRRLVKLQLTQLIKYLIVMTGFCGSVVWFVQQVFISRIEGVLGQLIIGGASIVIIFGVCLWFVERNNLIKNFVRIAKEKL